MTETSQLLHRFKLSDVMPLDPETPNYSGEIVVVAIDETNARVAAAEWSFDLPKGAGIDGSPYGNKAKIACEDMGPSEEGDQEGQVIMHGIKQGPRA